MDSSKINPRFFLNYSPGKFQRVDESVRHAIALFSYTNLREEEVGQFDIEYDVKLSMREWGLRPAVENEVPRSKWAIYGANRTLVLDSTMRDQHVVHLNLGRINVDHLRVAIDPPAAREAGFSLYSLSRFDKLDFLLEFGSEAKSQVRWFSMPGTSCEGILLATKKFGLSFIPLIADPRAADVFIEKQFYSTDFIFEYAMDNHLFDS